MPRYTGPTITITLPNTPEIREALMLIGGQGVDEHSWYWDDAAVDAALRRADVTPMRGRDVDPLTLKLSPETCVAKSEAYRIINEAILEALGVVV